ncbi:aspartate aminotransferase family protein [Halocella sp. SP3-1]|uniref:aspartate aminotransferase family protein n=1 Tax=Halocella sp. SP3-1 TaxID=2382161 RepID=UPI000F751141|nr:aspartate aminotransferase family protein [Halocella sp. SP3-1]AZO93989.1 aspartate aminotransferase family protein [Halocella sp. SP3-1]
MSENLINVDDALQLKRDEVIEYYKKHVNPSLAKMFALLNFDRHYVRASGTSVWDSDGNEYLDFLGGYGALNLGHNPPAVLEAIKKVTELPNILQAGMGTMASAAAYNLSLLAPGELSNSFFCNSGTEAVEGAIKTAKIASGKSRVLYCRNSFHGKTMGSLSVTGREKYQKPFGPLVPGNELVDYGNLKALEVMLENNEYAAFIIEPIQGEGGINLPTDEYFKGVRELCTEHDVYLILDEIQTGFGRTGSLFACQQYDVVPDIMCLAKSLGGGVMPVGAFITTKEIWNKAYGGMDKALLHTSTFGGNTLAAAAAIAAMKELVDQDLSQQALEKGNYLLGKLNELAEEYDIIKEVRGRGLMIGLEFNQPDRGVLDKLSGGIVSKLSHEYMGSLVAGALHNEHHIITAYTLNNPNVIRFEPPLIVTYQELDKLVEALEDVFSRYKGLFGMAIKSAKTVIGGLFKK